ncbi:MAG TPA: NADP-dependent oxidoreductase [Solirubrobacteraceae bacterium]|jgi:NADPH:quinone reductase-like Zn-dependent oxidoreductase|nr:NADP-dependent oxidoreductase [Solirubrobacteraceae bacterium]
MRAVVVHETGGPEVLSVEDVPTPEPADGQVLVRVHAASVNPIDWKIRSGGRPAELPAILGNDISGTVEVSRADELSDGDDVFGFAASGGYAEYALSVPAAVALKPPGVTHEQAAAIPVAGLTAWQALFDRGRLEQGQRALVAGAAGGVGHLAVQFAKRAGAHVIGIGSTHNRDFVLGLGADEYVDYTQQDVREAVSEVDVALDAVGGETTETLVSVMREGGILLTIASAPPEDAARQRGVRAELLIMSPDPEAMGRIAGRVADGEIRIEISELLPLADVQSAHRLSQSGHTRGKIVLTLD